MAIFSALLFNVFIKLMNVCERVSLFFVDLFGGLAVDEPHKNELLYFFSAHTNTMILLTCAFLFLSMCSGSLLQLLLSLSLWADNDVFFFHIFIVYLILSGIRCRAVFLIAHVWNDVFYAFTMCFFPSFSNCTTQKSRCLKEWTLRL